MSVIFFEGFETIGTEVGLINRNLVLPRLRKRMSALNYLGDDKSTNMFLMNSEDGLGFAWNMGGLSANTISITLEDKYQVSTGSKSPTFIIGALVHIPFNPSTFEIFRLNVSPGFDPNLRVESSRHLSHRVASNVIEREDNVLEPGFWYFIEWKIKADGALGERGTAVITDDLPDDLEQSIIDEVPFGPITTINISDVEMYLPVWDDGTEYPESFEIRWRGIEYRAELVDNPDYDPEDEESEEYLPNKGQEPGTETEGFWLEIGPEQPDTVTSVPFASQFYFANDPVPTIYTTNSFDSTTVMTFTPPITKDSYLPEEDEEIIFGCQAEYEVRVNGVRSFGEVGVPTMVEGNVGILDNITFGTISGDDENSYVAYDNIYIIVVDGEGNDNFLGPVRVRTAPPNNTIQDDWEPSAVVSDDSNLIRENGVNYSTYINSEENSWEEEFEHESMPDEGNNAFAVKLEAEVRNQTAGNPSLNIGIHHGGSDITESAHVVNDGQSVVLSNLTESKPGGGVWDITSLNESTLHLQIDNGLGT